jgi:hypothetical protein
MRDAIKSLVENGIISNETREAITEAWDEKVIENKETVRAELREEFANRYKHDKSVMVESINKMVTESLTQELSEFAQDKRELAKQIVAHKRTMKEAAKKFESFVARQLAEEVNEFRSDRKAQNEATKKLEKFVIGQLAEEITEFAQDKQALTETKVKLVREAKAKLAQVEKKFVAKSASLVKEAVTQGLQTEITQLKEDISAARENMFGRKIFEAFASEFTLTHLSENKEIAQLRKQIGKRDTVIAESRKTLAKGKKLVESKDKQIRVITESTVRNKKIDSLVTNLTAEKAGTMRELLESVNDTARLGAAFDKYLPAVLNDGRKSKQFALKDGKQALTESRTAMTGNKKTTAKRHTQVDATVIDIATLAGLKKIQA